MDFNGLRFFIAHHNKKTTPNIRRLNETPSRKPIRKLPASSLKMMLIVKTKIPAKRHDNKPMRNLLFIFLVFFINFIILLLDV